MSDKVIFVVSSDSTELEKGDKKEATGWYLPEAAHPYKVLKDAGYEIVFVSPKGGKAPMSDLIYGSDCADAQAGLSLQAKLLVQTSRTCKYKSDTVASIEMKKCLDISSGRDYAGDKECQEFLKEHQKELDNTKKPKDVNPSDFKALFYVGGHGPMFDLPENTEIAELAAAIYENNGVLGAVCHGTVGLLPVKLKSGEYVIKGKRVTSFTNKEEDIMKLSKQMPFMLETKLGEKGAIFEGADSWQCNVISDQRLVTGQNPQSATLCGQEMVKLLKAA